MRMVLRRLSPEEAKIMSAARTRRCSPYLAVVLLIFAFGYLANPFQQSLLIPIACGIGFVVFLLVGVLLFCCDVLERPVPVVCPGCNQPTLRRIMRARDHFECVRCGGRYKRAGLAAPWEDASGSDDEAVYKNPSRAGRWTGYTPPTPEKSNTSGLLLRNKRMRHPSSSEDEPPVPAPKPSDSLADPWIDHQVDAS